MGNKWQKARRDTESPRAHFQTDLALLEYPIPFSHLHSIYSILSFPALIFFFTVPLSVFAFCDAQRVNPHSDCGKCPASDRKLKG